MFKVPFPRLPTEAEIEESSLRRYDHAAFTFLDQWPAALHALSIPSKAHPLEQETVAAILKVCDTGKPPYRLTELAHHLDCMMDWGNYFVRLNSRSPKDATHPALPLTCAGRQAVSWIAGSERTFDDLCMFHGAKRPAFIYLREATYIPREWELRCFVKAGALIAITQYYADETNTEIQDDATRAELFKTIERLVASKLVPIIERPDFVVDVIPGRDGWRVLEINPYGMSDPILFGDYQTVEAEGGFRFAALKTAHQTGEK